jgi:hypothetical protein
MNARSTVAGWTEFTRMPCGASSFASDRMSPTTPCFEAACS